jgi:anti-sigma B factor antagonist
MKLNVITLCGMKTKGETIMQENDFIITEDRVEGGSVRFTVKGRLNSSNAPALEQKLEEALSNGNVNIILNMSQVLYMSSIGIRVILKIFKQTEELGGKFRIERPAEIVRNVLGMVALDEMMLV